MAGIIPRIRVITDDLARATEQAYKARPKGVRGPVTINELPEDVAVNLVKSVETIAPKTKRQRLVTVLRDNKYKLAAGGTIAGGAILAGSDPEFIDAILSLAPDAVEQFVSDVMNSGESESMDVATATQEIGDVAYAQSYTQRDTDGHLNMRPVDQTVGAGLGIALGEVERLQALTDIMELAISAAGSHDALEAVIFLGNNTSPEDRAVLMDNLRFRRGY